MVADETPQRAEVEAEYVRRFDEALQACRNRRGYQPEATDRREDAEVGHQRALSELLDQVCPIPWSAAGRSTLSTRTPLAIPCSVSQAP